MVLGFTTAGSTGTGSTTLINTVPTFDAVTSGIGGSEIFTASAIFSLTSSAKGNKKVILDKSKPQRPSGLMAEKYPQLIKDLLLTLIYLKTLRFY